ncbi:MAG: hypothetical protein AAF242_00045 [Bacteroidota bacterium]
MFRLDSDIRINGIQFSRVESIKIEKDASRIDNVCTIKIPTTARIERGGEVITEIETSKVFKSGDEVSISIGYDGNLREEFRGFVRKVHPKTPLEIECDDEIYLLRRKNLKASFKNTTLKSLLEFIVKHTGIRLSENIPVINFDVFYFKNISAARALQKIKDEYGLTIYFRDWMELYVGVYNDNDGVQVKFSTDVNINRQQLEWVTEDDVRLKIKAINVRKNNTKQEIEFGDEDGEIRTIYFYNLSSKEDLRTKAKQELERIKYEGYRGSITTFLLPVADVGNIAIYQDADFPERSGRYLIDSSIITYSRDGGRRKIKLGVKIP